METTMSTATASPLGDEQLQRIHRDFAAQCFNACWYLIDKHDRSAQEDERIDELILWASYPSEAVTREGLRVASIWGSEDGLATGEKREETAGLLPADATVTVIEGGIHSFFGDYGIQPGDGNATIPREAAQGQIVEATLAALAG